MSVTFSKMFYDNFNFMKAKLVLLQPLLAHPSL